MAETLTVQLRDGRGSRNSRRLRRQGWIPAILYGHGADPVSLSIPAEQVSSAIRHGSRLVELTGGVTEKALLNELQWDTYGSEVIHVDLMRVSEGERVTITVAVELKGQAPGVAEGGVVDLVLHELEIECPVTAIPEKISISVRNLHLDQQITAGEIELPADVTLVTDPEITAVTCYAAKEEELAAAPAAAAEPELIGRKTEAEEEEEG
jgi:large subunit ribosomal protein L25